MTVTMTRSAYGLEVGDDAPWRMHAVCARDPGMFVEFPAGHKGATQISRAAHICRSHCPVLAQCLRDTERHRPSYVVQAGILWPHYAGRKTTRPRESGCGAWCRLYVGGDK